MNQPQDEQYQDERPDGAKGASEPKLSGAEEQDGDAVAREMAEAMAAIRKERDDLEQRMLRIAADYQNYVRRSEQNAANARDQQLIEVSKGLVTVLDHFDRALEVDSDKSTTRDVLTGVVMVRDEMLRTLERLGVQRVDVTIGEPFDPNRHEALMRQPSDEVEADHVTAQFQPGYMLKDKVIRPAKVSVAE